MDIYFVENERFVKRENTRKRTRLRIFNDRLHIYRIFTDIKIVLTLFFCVAALIFPLFLSIDLAYTGENAELYFGVRLFGFIKLLSGYAEKIKEGFAFHLSEKKDFLILSHEACH